MEDAKAHIDIPRRVIIVEQDTKGDKAVADYLAKENRAHAKREYVEVDKRNRNHVMVCIGDRANRSQD
jgi:hypothetical protein